MASPARPVVESRLLRTWTALIALLTFVLVGYLVALLVAAGYTSATDKPFNLPGLVICVAVVLVVIAVGFWSYRTGRQRALRRSTLVRRISMRLSLAGVFLSMIVVLLSAPI